MVQSPHNRRGDPSHCATRVQARVTCVLPLLIAVVFTACTAVMAVEVDTVAVVYPSMNHQTTSPAHVHANANTVALGLSPSTAQTECHAVAQCLNHSVCAQCLAVLNSTTHSHGWDDWWEMGAGERKVKNKAIFKTLQSNPSIDVRPTVHWSFFLQHYSTCPDQTAPRCLAWPPIHALLPRTTALKTPLAGAASMTFTSTVVHTQPALLSILQTVPPQTIDCISLQVPATLLCAWRFLGVHSSNSSASAIQNADCACP